MQHFIYRWKALATLLLLLGLGLPSSVYAYSPCTVDKASAANAFLTIPPGTAVTANALPGTVIWTSPLFTTQMSCPATSGDLRLYAGSGSTAVSLPDSAIQTTLSWKLSYMTSATNDFSTSINTSTPAPGLSSGGFYGSSGGGNAVTTFLVTWKLILKTGTAATAAGFAALPGSYTMFQLSDGTRNAASTNFILTGLNNIRFVDTTCTIKTLPSDNIRLNTVSRSALAFAGQSAGRTPFWIQMTNCSRIINGAVANSVPIRTLFYGPQVDSTTGNLILTGANPASSVQLQLLNANGSVINLAGASGMQNVTPGVINAGSATLGYGVQYVAVGGPAGSGPANSVVAYTIEYD